MDSRYPGFAIVHLHILIERQSTLYNLCHFTRVHASPFNHPLVIEHRFPDGIGDFSPGASHVKQVGRECRFDLITFKSPFEMTDPRRDPDRYLWVVTIICYILHFTRNRWSPRIVIPRHFHEMVNRKMNVNIFRFILCCFLILAVIGLPVSAQVYSVIVDSCQVTPDVRIYGEKGTVTVTIRSTAAGSQTQRAATLNPGSAHHRLPP
jgi:hypothetical protein